MKITRLITYSLISFILFILLGCGHIRSTQKENARIFFVMVFNEERLFNLEDDICKYYNANNGFPKNQSMLIAFLDSLKDSLIDHEIFSTLSIDTLNANSIKYNFSLLPYIRQYDLGPKFNYFDSLEVKVFNGKLFFSDSLFAETNKLSDSLEIDSLVATVYKDGSIYNYTEEDLDIIRYNYKERILNRPNCISIETNYAK